MHNVPTVIWLSSSLPQPPSLSCCMPYIKIGTIKCQKAKKTRWVQSRAWLWAQGMCHRSDRAVIEFLWKCSVAQSYPNLCDPMDCSMPVFPVFTIFWSLLKLMSIESVMPSNYLIPCCPLFLLPSVFPSIRVFSSESALHIRRPKYCSFSFRISPSNEYSVDLE